MSFPSVSPASFGHELYRRMPRFYPFNALLPPFNLATGGLYQLFTPIINVQLPGIAPFTFFEAGEDFFNAGDIFQDARFTGGSGQFPILIECQIQFLGAAGGANTVFGIGFGSPFAPPPWVGGPIPPCALLFFDFNANVFKMITCIGNGTGAVETVLSAPPIIAPDTRRFRMAIFPNVRVEAYIDGNFSGVDTTAPPNYANFAGNNLGATIFANCNVGGAIAVNYAAFQIQSIGFP